MNREKFQYIEIGILVLLLISTIGFFSYLYINLEDFKDMQNYQSFCEQQGYINIDVNGYQYG